MKTTKKYLSLFLVLTTILSSITVFCVSATQLSDDTDVVVTYTEDVVIEHELVPVMSRSCGYGDLTSWYDMDHATKASILKDVKGNYKAVVGNNPDIYYGSNGLIYLCGTGAYSGRTYPTDLQRSSYL